MLALCKRIGGTSPPSDERLRINQDDFYAAPHEQPGSTFLPRVFVLFMIIHLEDDTHCLPTGYSATCGAIRYRGGTFWHRSARMAVAEVTSSEEVW